MNRLHSRHLTSLRVVCLCVCVCVFVLVFSLVFFFFSEGAGGFYTHSVERVTSQQEVRVGLMKA